MVESNFSTRYRRQWLVASLLVGGICCGGLAAGTAAPPVTSAKPIVTSKTNFRIPFRFDRAVLQRMNAKELHLYVSTDQGATWEKADTVSPDAAKFEYHATADGQYWFSVKTVDGAGQLQPPGNTFEPGLKVIVDTREPELELRVEQITAEKVQLSWKVTDDNIDTTTLKLEYLQPGIAGWQNVSVIPRVQGQTSWTVTEPGVVAVRGSILDFAGNSGRGQSQIRATPGLKPQKANAPAAGEPDGPIAETPRQVAEAEIGLPGQPPVTRQLEVPATPKIELPANTPGTAAVPNPVDGSGEDFTPSLSPPLAARPGVGTLVIPREPNFPEAAKPTPQATAPLPRPPVAERTPAFSTGLAPLPEPKVEAQSPSIPLPVFEAAPNSGLTFGNSPVPNFGESAQPRNGLRGRTKVVSTRRFQLAYQLDDVGPSGVSQVELFITQDGGRRWWKYGDDSDMQSPIEVHVPTDGDYGFAIRVRSGAGLAAEPPGPGTVPEIAVAVDQTAPTVEMLPLQQGTGASINQILIRWKVVDQHLGDKPIALYSATNRDGPWQPITDWRPDTGSFVWTLKPGSPAQVFVRVVAVDSAGNQSYADSPQPLMIDLSRPVARFVDVELPQDQPR